MMDEFSDIVVENVPDHKAGAEELVPLPEPETPKTRPGIFGASGKRENYQRKQRTKKPPPPSTPGQFVEPIRDFYQMVGLALGPFMPDVAVAIVQQSEECALAWDKVAQKNEAVRKALLAFTNTSLWGGLIMAHAPIAGAIVMNHTGFPDSPMGENVVNAVNRFRGDNETDGDNVPSA